MSFCLLENSLLRTVTCGRATESSLPDLMAAAAADELDALIALRPHQRHAVHAFLAQLGAIALHNGGVESPPTEPDAWRDLLRALTASHPDDAPWHLVVRDPRAPAFLQPPSPDGAPLEGGETRTPDDLDVLVTAKNMDVKQARAAEAHPDDWIYALISLQTMQGYSGRDHFGIARMNGGFSSRPFVGLAPASGRPGGHLARDWRAMLAGRERIARDFGYPFEGGHALLWTLPWDGRAQLALADLDPFFVEVCRRVRLRDEGGRIFALTRGSAAARIAAKDAKGVTGDFWAPINEADGAAFSLAQAGFSARVLCRLLFDKGYRHPPALQPLPGEREADSLLIARGVPRGQGRTDGWHERIIPLRPRLKRALFGKAGRESAGKLAEAQLKETEQIGRALRTGCAVVASGGAEGGPKQDHYKTAEAYETRLEAVAEALFFAALQDRLEEPERARANFLRALVRAAEALLAEAVETIPCPAMRRPKARFLARRAFRSVLHSSKGPLANERDLFREPADAA